MPKGDTNVPLYLEKVGLRARACHARTSAWGTGGQAVMRQIQKSSGNVCWPSVTWLLSDGV